MAKKKKTNQKAMNIDCAIDLGTENVVMACKHPVFNTETCVPMLDGGYDFPAAVYMEKIIVQSEELRRTIISWSRKKLYLISRGN